MMTVWLVWDINGEENTLTEDLSIIFHLQEQLDDICDQLNVTPISHFFDVAELAHNIHSRPPPLDQLHPSEWAEIQVDIDDIYDNPTPIPIDNVPRWYPAQDLLQTTLALKQYYQTHSQYFSSHHFELIDLLNEFDLIIPILNQAVEQAYPVHLKVLY